MYFSLEMLTKPEHTAIWVDILISLVISKDIYVEFYTE